MICMVSILTLISVPQVCFFSSFGNVQAYHLQLLSPSPSCSIAFEIIWQIQVLIDLFGFDFMVHWISKIREMTSSLFLVNRHKAWRFGPDWVLRLYLKTHLTLVYYLWVFHWSLSDRKSLQISRSVLSNQTDFNNAIVWMVTIFLSLFGPFQLHQYHLLPSPTCFTAILVLWHGLSIWISFPFLLLFGQPKSVKHKGGAKFTRRQVLCFFLFSIFFFFVFAFLFC